MHKTSSDIIALLTEQFAGNLQATIDAKTNMVSAEIELPILLEVIALLKTVDGGDFSTLTDIWGADFPTLAKRFAVYYSLLSMPNNLRITLKLMVAAETTVPSAHLLFPAAIWFEREAWDMFGVVFDGHPDLRRILTDYGFEGYPLRKDFPLTGYKEVRYDEQQQRVVYEPVVLQQDYRQFDFLSPWAGTKYVLPGDEKADVAPAGVKI